jgi:hypothetical protein
MKFSLSRSVLGFTVLLFAGINSCADIGNAYPDGDAVTEPQPEEDTQAWDTASPDGATTTGSDGVESSDSSDSSDDTDSASTGDQTDGSDGLSGVDGSTNDDLSDGIDGEVVADGGPSSDVAADGEDDTDAVDSSDTTDAVDSSDTTDAVDSSDTTDGSDSDDPICSPCRIDADCPQNDCVDYGAPGSYCGQACDAFECPPAADGKTTDCFVTNSYGTCAGLVSCQAEELSECSALVPGDELCDGVDNDCDGQTDETWQDADSDGEADCIDLDDDGDEVNDLTDNCPLAYNPTQDDLDLDGTGDVCDPDDDGDGVNDEDDCAPQDPELTIGKPEACNGKDDDCDGLIDETDALGCSFYWPDGDNDGFGGDGLELCLCAPTTTYLLTEGGDCDDTTAFISPTAPETCDTKDNDCDSQTDEADAIGCSVYYYDGDGDGYYADGAESQCLCVLGIGSDFSGVFPGDCNDTTPLINPTAPERCDGTDENCNEVTDDGCDDDQDGFCDSNMPFIATGTITCPFGGGDCDDEAFAVKPGAIEICDGVDTNCSPADNKDEGTVEACGPLCQPCPEAPAGASYTCTGVGPDGKCVLSCSGGQFCEDCNCDGNTIHVLGSAVNDGKVIYDAYLDTFRVGYYSAGGFRLRAISKTGGLGNDVISVAGVTKWTDWGLAQNPVNGQFVFAWTAYPDSSIRVGIASNNGTPVNQYVVATDIAGALARRNVQLGYHDSSQTFLAVWDEGTGIDIDIRGLLLEANAAPIGSVFGVVGGSGDQVAPVMVARGSNGYALSWATDGGSVGYRLMDHTAGSATAYTLGSVKAGTSPQIWYGPGLDRGILQWLGTDNQYHVRLVSPAGPIGPEISLGGPAGGVSAAPNQNAFYLLYTSAGQVQRRRVNASSAAFIDTVQTVSEGENITKIIGAVTHPLGYSLVVWSENSGLRGRLLPP